jgi:hypothetical protein
VCASRLGKVSSLSLLCALFISLPASEDRRVGPQYRADGSEPSCVYPSRLCANDISLTLSVLLISIFSNSLTPHPGDPGVIPVTHISSENFEHRNLNSWSSVQNDDNTISRSRYIRNKVRGTWASTVQSLAHSSDILGHLAHSSDATGG